MPSPENAILSSIRGHTYWNWEEFASNSRYLRTSAVSNFRSRIFTEGGAKKYS